MSETMTTRSRGQLSRRLFGHDAVIFYILIAVVVISMVSVNFFASTLTVGFLLIQVIPILLIAMPMALVIVSGEIDLSVASTAGLTSAAMGVLWRDSGLDIGSSLCSRCLSESCVARSTDSSSRLLAFRRWPSRLELWRCTADSLSSSSVTRRLRASPKSSTPSCSPRSATPASPS